MLLDDGFRDNQSQPGSPGLHSEGVSAPEKFREQLSLLGGVQSNARVENFDHDVLGIRARADADLTGRGVLDCIGYQVTEDLNQSRAVPRKARQPIDLPVE